MPRTSNKELAIREIARKLLLFFFERRLREAPELDHPADEGSLIASSSSCSSFASSVSSFDDSSLSTISTISGSTSSLASSSSVASLASELEEVDSAAEELDFVCNLVRRLEATRVLHERRTPRGMERLVDRLQRLRQSRSPGDADFYRHLVRVHPRAFDNLAALLSTHSEFANRDPRRLGASVQEQLAVALYRFGRFGNAGGVIDIAFACGCSEGSVVNYTKRVAAALYDLRSQALCWASERERWDAQAWVAARTGCEEMARGWSMLDGSLLPLALKPGKHAHHREYYDRKSQYSLNLQLIVLPHTLRIIEFVAGYKGTTQDSRAVAASEVIKNPRIYLDEGEFIWADGGYGLSDYTCGPYDHVVAQKSRDFRGFNYAVSSIRVRSEHGFAYLKGRFQALRGLRWLLRDGEDHTILTRLVVAMLVAHNTALQQDGPEERAVFYDLTGLSDEALTSWQTVQQRSPEQDELERRAWERRLKVHQAQKAAQEISNRGRSRTEIDKERKTSAKELREEMHVALFAALDREFENTTPMSRMANQTKKEWKRAQKLKKKKKELQKAKQKQKRALSRSQQARDA